MTRKISDFFTKKSIKTEIGNQNVESEASASIKLESIENPQNLTPYNNSGLENQEKINENVKTEAETQLLVILRQQKIHKCPVPVKIEDNEPKSDEHQICKKNYSSKYKLNDHVKNIHENPGSYKCDVCKVGFNTKAYLTKHQRTHMKNRPKPFKCDKCDFATDLKHIFNRHLKAHERIIKRCDKCNLILIKNKIHDCRLNCKYCGKKFSQKATVTNHIKRYHEQETKGCFYECDICGLKFIQKRYLKSHMKAKHADGKIQVFTCDFDGKTFSSKKKIGAHMKKHQPPVKCDFCHINLSIRQLKVHIKNSHTGFKQPRKKYIPKQGSFQCPICFKIFSTKTVLKRHISVHNKTIKCKFCGKMFGTQSNLKIHIRDYHENPKALICNICGHESTLRSNLKTHMKTHDPNRARDLKCTQCDFATDNKISFQYHLNSHKRRNAKIAAMNNPHKCSQCPAVKDSQKSLKKHMLSIHPKVLFECDICGKQIKSKSQIMRHIKSVHKTKC